MILLGRTYSGREFLLSLLLVILGIIFICSFPALFDLSFALRIHRDLSPDAGFLMIMAKSWICFFAGIAYFIAAYGLHRRSSFVISGTIGAIPFFVLYMVEVMLWGIHHPFVWVGFLTFGLCSLIIGISCWLLGKKYSATSTDIA